MQLLSDSAGWALVDHRLKWTDDDGLTRRDITPVDLPTSDARWSAGELAYFLDASNGWLLATRPHDFRTPSDLIVWRTTDGGATWTKTRLDGPEVDPNAAPPVFAPLALQFVDARTGWFALLGAGGTESETMIFSTLDGGASWSGLPGVYGFTGSMGPLHFANAQEAWQVRDENPFNVSVTHDAGRSWDEVTFQRPTGSGAASSWLGAFAYGDIGRNVGMVPAQFDYGAGGTGIYVTGDAGMTWSLASRAQDSCGVFDFVSASTWLQATVSNLFTTREAGAHWGAVDVTWPTTAAAGVPAPLRIEFADAQHGWAVISESSDSAALVATDDGGHTWRILRP